ncbi:G-protein coupled receptor 54-like [Babylonia areolata]|uniref:G-protein coupled receptor 54-like n=1 Tax=Babylonia areolata TaxID=304850 RepID=UPI003FD128A7
MAGSTNTLGVQTDDVPSGVADHELTSSTSSLLLGTMVTTHVTNHSIVDMVTEKPFGEFLEVKASILVERICIPIIVSVGLLGNFLCFVTLVFTSLRNTSTCVYMAAIAVLDCSILGQALCVLFGRYFGHAKFFMGNDWNCGFQHFLFYFAIHFDVLLLLAMTVDRFIVVRFPLKAQRLCTPKSAIKVIIGLGIFSFALNFQIFFNKRLIPTGDLRTH